MNPDTIQMIVAFAAVAVVLVPFLYFRFRSRADTQAIVRAAIDRGQELSPELIEKLMGGRTDASPHRDLRRGFLALALGIGIGLVGAIMGGEAVRPSLAIAALPLVIGLAYIGLWIFVSRN
jgi:hypothetical protein